MDEIARLEREIYSLQRSLREQNSEAARARQKIIDKNRRDLEKLQADMKRALNSHDRQTQDQYEKLLKQYQKSLSKELNSELSRLDKNYESLLKHVKKNEELLAKKNKELEELVAKIRADISERDRGSSNEAAEYLRAADKILREVDKKPHEKFLPKRFEVFSNSMRDGRQLFRAGLFEAASAVAISARSGLERLGYNIDDKVQEWEKNFDLLKFKLEYLRGKINQEISDRGKEINKTLRAEIIDDINFWSRDLFAEVIEASKKAREIIKASEQIGQEDYIKRPDSPSLDELKKFIEEIDEADKKLSGLSIIYKKRYSASCERSDMGEEIIDFMTAEINLEWQEDLTGFKDKDFREWLRIVFTNSSRDYIYVYIIPVESEKNNDVVNHVIIHIDFSGSENQIYARDIYSHVREAVNLSDEDAIEYAGDLNSLKLNSNKSFRDTANDLEKLKHR